MVGWRLVAAGLAGVLSGLLGMAALEPAAEAEPRTSGDPRRSVAMPHDFNGDGYADLAIGAAYRSVSGQDSAGAVYVIDGSAHGLRAADSWLVTMDSPGIKGRARGQSYFGQSVTSADWDADGYADLAVRAREDLLVIYGSRSGLSRRDRWIDLADLGPGYYNLSGPSTAVGDFNGDEIPDLALGRGFGEEENGEVLVLLGSPRGLDSTRRTYFGRDTQGVPGGAFVDDHFAYEMAAGDVTGDGYDDLVLTSGERNGDSSSLYLFRGSPAGIRVAGNKRLLGGELNGAKPVYLDAEGDLAVADFDDDGHADVAIGAPRYDWRSRHESSAVVVLPGSGAGLVRRAQVWQQGRYGVPGSGGEDGFGSRLTVGDLNADGSPDLAVSAPSENAGGRRDTGAVTVLYGTSRGLTGYGSEVWSQARAGVKGTARRDDGFGSGSLRVLDVDGDHAGDLVVLSPYDAIGEQTGSVNVLSGSMRGTTAHDQLWHANSRGLAGRTSAGVGFGEE